MGHSSTTESEDGFLPTGSPLSNDGDAFSGSSNGGVVLKKGPWTTAEDAILVDYVKKHGEGNWNAVQKHSGLSRCGKSCRLRWANHLRPNLKKGAFTPEEERLIIELHAKMGNKWARMAAHMPGRTDNEIKNYWNTRIKRRQRAGLPLYPPELCLHAQPENQQLLSPSGVYEEKGCHDIIQSNGYPTPDTTFDGFDIPYPPEFSGISANISKCNGFSTPQFYSFVSQTVGVAKFSQKPDEAMADYGRSAAYDRAQTDSCFNKMSQSFGLRYSYGPDHTKKVLPFGVNQDSHHMSNSNVIFSASKHFSGAQKSELPSLQYQETDFGLWDPPSELLDSIVQSPPVSLSGPFLSSSHCPSPGSSGLLEDLLYEAKAMNNQNSDWASSSNFSHGDNSTLIGSKNYIDPSSPSGSSMESIFNVYTPTGTIGSSMEDEMPVFNVKSEVMNESWILDSGTETVQNNLDCCRPDAMLGSCGGWVEQSVKQQRFFASSTNGVAIAGDDLGNEVNTRAIRGLKNPCSWNNMPPVFQMSDISTILPNF